MDVINPLKLVLFSSNLAVKVRIESLHASCSIGKDDS